MEERNVYCGAYFTKVLLEKLVFSCHNQQISLSNHTTTGTPINAGTWTDVKWDILGFTQWSHPDFPPPHIHRQDCYRVVDYGGGSLLAMGSKDRLLRLLYVVSETRAVGLMQGHIGSVRAVLLCEDRDLAITASYDATIRWGGVMSWCIPCIVLHAYAFI